jgi:hypothetical protein
MRDRWLFGVEVSGTVSLKKQKNNVIVYLSVFEINYLLLLLLLILLFVSVSISYVFSPVQILVKVCRGSVKNV